MNPSDDVHYKIMSEKIKSKIKELPENLRAPFVLYQIHGMKYREISEILDSPINTVKVNILRARKKLQEELKHYETV